MDNEILTAWRAYAAAALAGGIIIGALGMKGYEYYSRFNAPILTECGYSEKSYDAFFEWEGRRIYTAKPFPDPRKHSIVINPKGVTVDGIKWLIVCPEYVHNKTNQPTGEK